MLDENLTPICGSKMAASREPSPPITMPHSIQSYQGSLADGGDTESVMSDLSWDGTPDENILSGSSRAATSLAIHEEDEGSPNLRFLDDPDGDDTLIMEEDAYHRLTEMEEKLKMAGEFGNALLEENQELRTINQQIQQETSTKIEALEQERHELRMKLETARTEKENVSYDLRMEVESLRKELASQNVALEVANSNKQGIIGELMDQRDQNQKLAGQLQEMRQERDAVHDRLKLVEKENESISLFNHESSLGKSEKFRAEASALREENKKLRDQLITVSSEHETMMSSLEEAKERNMMLEKQVVELEQRLQFRETELRDLNRLHEETLQELGAARSRANTRCSSSLYDELETAELTGYESSEEDCEVDEKADVIMPTFRGGRGLHRQMSLAEELAASLGAMEPSGQYQQQHHPQQSQEMSEVEESNGFDKDQTPRHRRSVGHENVNCLEGRSLSLAEEFAKLDNGSSPRHQSGCFPRGKSRHERTLSVDEISKPLYTSSPRHQQRSLSLKEEMQSQGEAMCLAGELGEASSAGQGNIMSLADELSQASMSTQDVKCESSNTLVSMVFEEEHFGSPNDRGKSRNGFILGDDDDDNEDNEEGDEEEGMMVGITMATQFPNQGPSLADELADMGYQHGQDGDDSDNDEDDKGEVSEKVNSNSGGKMIAKRERAGGGEVKEEGKGEGGGRGGRGVGRSGRDRRLGRGRFRGKGHINTGDDDAEVSSLETPKASPARNSREGDLHIKYRQVEDVLHWVHVTLSHIILELHSLVRLPLTDLGIMHASTVLHSVHPSHHQSAPAPWPMIGSDLDIEEDDDIDDSDGGDFKNRHQGIAGGDGGGSHGNRRSEFIGEKVKSQLSVLRSMLSIVVNGSPKMASPKMEDCVIQIEEEEINRERRKAGLDMEDMMAIPSGATPDRQSLEIQQSVDEMREDSKWQVGTEELMDRHPKHAAIPSSVSQPDQMATSFSSRSQSVPDFGKKNQRSFWS